MMRLGFTRDDFQIKTINRFATQPGRINQQVYARSQVETNENHLSAEVKKIQLNGISHAEHASVNFAKIRCAVKPAQSQAEALQKPSGAENRIERAKQLAEEKRLKTVEKLALKEERENNNLFLRQQQLNEISKSYHDYNVSTTQHVAQFNNQLEKQQNEFKNTIYKKHDKQKLISEDAMQLQWDRAQELGEVCQDNVADHEKTRTKLIQNQTAHITQKVTQKLNATEDAYSRSINHYQNISNAFANNSQINAQQIEKSNIQKFIKESVNAGKVETKHQYEQEIVEIQKQQKLASIDSSKNSIRAQRHIQKMQQRRDKAAMIKEYKVTQRFQKDDAALQALQERQKQNQEIFKAENEANQVAAETMRNRFERSKNYKHALQTVQ